MSSRRSSYVPKPLPHRRQATVSASREIDHRVPFVRLRGSWIEGCGLAMGSVLDVLVEPCRITLTLAAAPPAESTAAAGTDPGGAAASPDEEEGDPDAPPRPACSLGPQGHFASGIARAGVGRAGPLSPLG
jgi:hypothetical protein